MNKKLLKLVLGVCLFVSCSEKEIITLPEVEAVQANINLALAKSAKIEMLLSQPHEVHIDYWPEGQDEFRKTVSLDRPEGSRVTAILTDLKENTSYVYAIRFEKQEFIDHDKLLRFQTAERPAAVDLFYDESNNQISSNLDGHFLFHKTGHPSVIMMVDGRGQLVWYRTSPNMVKVANLTHRNTIISIESSSDQGFSDGDRILETNLAGDTLLLLNYGENDFNKIPHHDIFLNQDNHVVFLTQETQNEFSGDGILILDRTGAKLWEWSSFSEFNNPDIADYVQPWANSLVEEDGYYYVSFRALSQIWKIDSSSGKVEWKLGNGGDFELDSHASFMFQHFAHLTSEDEILLFDNGASENRPYSRILSLSLTDQGQTISPKTNIRLPDEYFSPFMGSVQQMNQEEFLVCSATKGVILSTNHFGQINWKLKAQDRIYRCVYIENIFR